jgi:hypothetical protein
MTFYGPVVALSLLFLVRARAKVVGTTLSAVWGWAVAAVLVVGGIEFALSVIASESDTSAVTLPAWAMPARYAAAVLALCPTIALLGAKRPQDRVWQWVVLAFWGIMLVPAARVLLLYADSRVSPHAAQGILLLVVVAMGAVNWLATRFAVAAVLAASAQLLLVAPYTPMSSIIPDVGAPFALVAVLAALMACWLLEFWRPSRDSVNRIWLDFRDQFGLFWAARVMARVNAAARAHGWPIVVTWRCLQFNGADEHARKAFERSLRMLLRRFVSSAWLDERAGGA